MLLALTMLFALASCGSSDDEEDTTENVETSDTETTDDAENTDDSEGEDGETIDVDYSDPIILGHIADLTGNEASTGLLASAAMQFAVDYFNSIGGVNGRAIDVVEMDAQSDSSVAATAAQSLVESSGASVILGPTQIGHKSAVAAYAADAEVPAVYYNGTPSAAVTNNEYVIGLGGSTNQLGSTMAAYLYNELGYETIVTITQDNTGGQNYMNPLIEEFEALGGTVVDQLWVPASESDTSSYMMSAASAGADCIVAWLSGSQAINLWTCWYDQGVCDSTPMQACSHGGFTDYFIWMALSNSNSAIVDTALEDGVYAPITYAYSLDNEDNDALLEYYESYDWAAAGLDASTYGSMPVGSNMFGAIFAAVKVVVETMKTLDDPTDSVALYEALQSVDMDTAEGHVTIDSSRLATKDIHIVKVVQLDDGSFNYEVVKTYEDVSADGYSE
ncbi:MAG: ABC transporter substrate-binding protein [Oscillospiraceae bacterium]|nr:ABC transporter substrate-binding protein [Oscillospiraceae bacterium]